MLSSQEVLDYLDEKFNQGKMPFFDNLHVDYMDSRLLLFKNRDRWLMIFDSVVWWPSSNGLEIRIDLVGSDINRDDYFYSIQPSQIIFNESRMSVRQVVIRGIEINIEELEINPDYNLQPEPPFWVSVALMERYKNQLHATGAELAEFIPPGFEYLLTIEEWDHPDCDRLPSQTETFPRLAEILVTCDPSLWKPVAKPNTDWRLWLPK